MIWVAVAVAGGLGAACRYLLDRAISTRSASRLPWGTVVVNVTGSLVAGAIAGLAADAVVGEQLQLVAAGGFLGAYTTFSTWMFEAVRLLQRGATGQALGYLALTVGLGVGATAIGLLIGAWSVAAIL
jgi:fluoride exporter